MRELTKLILNSLPISGLFFCSCGVGGMDKNSTFLCDEVEVSVDPFYKHPYKEVSIFGEDAKIICEILRFSKKMYHGSGFPPSGSIIIKINNDVYGLFEDLDPINFAVEAEEMVLLKKIVRKWIE